MPNNRASTANSHYTSLAQRLADDSGVGLDLSAVKEFFYAGAQRQHNLESIRHLALFGDLLLLLTGVYGAGKTTLVSRLQNTCVEDLNCVVVSSRSESGASSQGLLKQVANASTIVEARSESEGALLGRVFDYYQRIRSEQGKRTLLIVDDADRYPVKDIALLVKAFKMLPEDSAAVLMLVGQPKIAELATALPTEAERSKFHQIHLKALNVSELNEYIEEGLRSAGYVSDISLSEVQLERLYRDSSGIPKVIDDRVASAFFEPKYIEREEGGLNKGSRLPSAVLFSIVAILLASFLFVSYQHNLLGSVDLDIASEFESGVGDASQNEERAKRLAMLDSALQRAKDSEAVEEDKLMSGFVDGLDGEGEASLVQENAELERLTPSAQDQPVENSDDTVADTNARESQSFGHEGLDDQELVDDLPLKSGGELPITAKEPSATNVTEEAALSSAEKTSVTTSTKTIRVEKFSSTESEEAVQIGPPKKVVSVGKSKLQQLSASGYREQSWLKQQNVSDYTLQVLGSYKRGTAIAFIDSVGSQADDLYYVESRYKGKPWFVVLYGQYSSHDDAQRAKKRLPKVIASEKPWVRKMSGLAPPE